jgi:hypothetical protein
MSQAFDEPRVVRGPEAVGSFLYGWRYGWEHWRFGEDDFFEAGDRVVTVLEDHARGAGVWTFRDGKVVHFEWFTDANAALAAVGLGPDRLQRSE